MKSDPRGNRRHRRLLEAKGVATATMTYTESHLQEAADRSGNSITRLSRQMADILAGVVRAADGSSSSASAAARATAATPSTISASSSVSSPTRRTDNVSELTARTNDEGWDTDLRGMAKGSRLRGRRHRRLCALGGGNLEKNISPTWSRHCKLCQRVGGAGSSAWSAAMADTRRRLPMPAHRPDGESRERYAAQPRRSRQSSGTCSCRIRR